MCVCFCRDRGGVGGGEGRGQRRGSGAWYTMGLPSSPIAIVVTGGRAGLPSSQSMRVEIGGRVGGLVGGRVGG